MLLHGKCTSHDGIVLLCATHDHDCIVKRTFCLFHELFGSTTNDDGASFGLWATSENVESINKYS